MEQILTAGGANDPSKAAAGLIEEFGSLPAALAGLPRRQKRAVAGDAAATRALRTFDTAMKHVLSLRMAAGPVLANWQALIDYLHADMAHKTRECLRVLHLNTGNMLIADDVMSEGTVDEAAVYFREVAHRSLELGSTTIILVHNHPSGISIPSASDIRITQKLIETLGRLSIAVYDHLIIGREGFTSLRAEGLIG